MDGCAKFGLFPTELGAMGIAWSQRGVAGVFLPELDEVALRRRIARRLPAAQECAAPDRPAAVRSATAGICALLRGERRDLTGSSAKHPALGSGDTATKHQALPLAAQA